jgi:hypothetical protein
MAEHADYQRALDQFSDWHWRLNNLYYIQDKTGRKTLFRMNWAQESLFDAMHYLNLILKARQLGFTTFIQIFMLDACLFNSNVKAGTIAHTLGDAETIFKDKVKFPYDNLPDQLRGAISATQDSAKVLEFANKSSIRVGTSLRSGTLQYLHISEYGKLCAKYPEKANEVRTGALNTIQAGQVAFIESTAEGQEGHFFDLCEAAQSQARMDSKLTALDFKFHFFPWFKQSEYSLDPDGVVISQEHETYFRKLSDQGIELTPGQKAWYAKKADQQGEDMKREFPSTPKEAFEASIEGAYYGDAMAKAEAQGRVGAFKAHEGLPVHTVWDIGVGDLNTIWFFQITPARIRLVGYFQGSGEGMPYYVENMARLATERSWTFGNHYLPHDAKVQEWGSGRTRVEQLQDGVPVEGKLFKIFPIVVPRNAVDDGINAVRAILPICEFDQADCSEGIKSLKSYRKEWDENLGTWKSTPYHNWASHGADAFRGLGMVYRDLKPPAQAPRPTKPVFYAKPDGSITSNMTILELINENAKKRNRYD